MSHRHCSTDDNLKRTLMPCLLVSPLGRPISPKIAGLGADQSPVSEAYVCTGSMCETSVPSRRTWTT